MAAARGARWLQHRVRVRLPLALEPIYLTTTWAPTDDTATVRELGVSFRPVSETIRDQLAWQRTADRL